MLTLDFFPTNYDDYNIEWAIDRTFNYQFQPEWMHSAILKEAVEKISHMHWEGGFVFISQKDGRAYSHQELATGVKSLALMIYFQRDKKPTWYKSSTFGANVLDGLAGFEVISDPSLSIQVLNLSDIITIQVADYQNFDVLLIDDLEQSIDNKERRHIRNRILNDLMSSAIPYLVLITREANLSYGFNEDDILTLHEKDGKCTFPIFYQDTNQTKSHYAEDCWVEDKQGGYQFIKNSLNITTILSAGGKSKIVKKLRKYLQKRDIPILLIYDRSGIGTEIMRIRTYIALLAINEYVEYLAPLSIEEIYILLSEEEELLCALKNRKENLLRQNETIENFLVKILKGFQNGYEKATCPDWCNDLKEIDLYPLWNKYLKK